MLNDKDIQKLIEVFATREEIVSKKEFEAFQEETRQSFSDQQVAEKVGLKLEY